MVNNTIKYLSSILYLMPDIYFDRITYTYPPDADIQLSTILFQMAHTTKNTWFLSIRVTINEVMLHIQTVPKQCRHIQPVNEFKTKPNRSYYSLRVYSFVHHHHIILIAISRRVVRTHKMCTNATINYPVTPK